MIEKNYENISCTYRNNQWIFKGVLLVFGLIGLSSSVVFAQGIETETGDDFFNKDAGAYGKALLPRAVLPGFLMSDPSNTDAGFPMYSDFLKSEYPLDLNISDLKSLEIVSPKYSAQSDVLIYSSELANNKEFLSDTPLVDIVVISDKFPIVSLSVGGKQVSNEQSSVIEVDIQLNLDEGENPIEITGVLSDNSKFRKGYLVSYRKLIKFEDSRSWLLYFDASIGFESNVRKSIDRKFAVGNLGVVNTVKKSDIFMELTATFFDQYSKNVDWYIGGGHINYLNPEHNYNDYNYGYGVVNFRQNSFLYSFNISLLNSITQTRYLFNYGLKFNYDFNYSEDPHSGLIVGGQVNYGTDSASKKETLSYAINSLYNAYYLVDWISLITFSGDLGLLDNVDEKERHWFIKLATTFIWKKTSWDIITGLDYTRKYFFNRLSLEIDNNSSRLDNVFTYFIRYNYALKEFITLYGKASGVLVISNFLPHYDIFLTVGVEGYY